MARFRYPCSNAPQKLGQQKGFPGWEGVPPSGKAGRLLSQDVM